MLGAVLADEPRQCMNRRESLVPCGRTTLPFLLQVNEKATHQFDRQIGHRQRVGGYPLALCHEREEQDEHVAVACARVGRQVPLRRDIFQEEPTNPMPQRGAVSHDGSPLRTLQSDGWLQQAAPESLSGSAVCPKGPHGRDKSLTWAEDRSDQHCSDTTR